MKLTGHPFIDSGIAGIASVLETEYDQVILKPEDLCETDIKNAVNILKNKYYYQLVRKDDNKSEKPLFYYLLQEVLPGSSWDQVKTGKVVKLMEKKFEEYVNNLLLAASNNPIGHCVFTGEDAHLTVGKSEIPMLASAEERPNSYPNLTRGLKVNAYAVLAILFSPIGIEKTINEKGKGGLNIIYHTYHWRFSVSIAKRNLSKINILLASNSIDHFRKKYYGNEKRGSWKIALLTLLHGLNNIPSKEQPQTILWSFNATNQGGQYRCTEISDSFIKLHNKRLLNPNAYRQLINCNDYVSKLILIGKPIVQYSLFSSNRTNKCNINNYQLIPNWSFQQFYAKEVLLMPNRLLNNIELAAECIVQDPKAVSYCLYEKIKPSKLVSNFNLPSKIIIVFSDYNNSWQHYLRAAVLWSSKGNKFEHADHNSYENPGKFETLITKVAHKLSQKYAPKKVAMNLSVRSIREYRNKWIGLLKDGACEWEDFLAFNPIDEAISIGNYPKTKTLREYLVAYLMGVANKGSSNSNEQLDEESIKENLIDFE